MLDFVKKIDEKAQFITSYCDDAFILAKVGLLKDKVSTTFPSDIDAMRDLFPDLEIRSRKIWYLIQKHINIFC